MTTKPRPSATGSHDPVKRTPLVVHSTADALPQVIDYVRLSCAAAGLSEQASFACELATDEAYTNIIEHAYRGQENGLVRVACWVDENRFVVQLQDHGQAFDPASIDKPILTHTLTDRPLGGLGIHFMRSLMDDVRFEFDAHAGNTVTMSKQLHEAAV